VVPSVATAPALPPLPQWLRPPHHTNSLAQKLQLRALGAGAGLRSTRWMLPAADLAGHYQHLQSMRGHQFAVYCISFDKHGRHIITGSDDTFIKVGRPAKL
jgi:WD40 repeat protein